MNIQLDHIQRLNLHALLGAQRGDVAAIRAIWAIQGRIALTLDEEKAIELRRDVVAGQEQVIWNPAFSLPPKEFEFTAAEGTRIKAAIETWNGYGVATDRRWLEPLVSVIFAAAAG